MRCDEVRCEVYSILLCSSFSNRVHIRTPQAPKECLLFLCARREKNDRYDVLLHLWTGGGAEREERESDQNCSSTEIKHERSGRKDK